MSKIIKLLTYNLLVFFILIFLFEIFFGYYFKKNNFGYIMRSERQKNQIYEVIHNDKKYKYTYKRNFHGFRGDEITPSSIKIIFEGSVYAFKKCFKRTFFTIMILFSLFSFGSILLMRIFARNCIQSTS